MLSESSESSEESDSDSPSGSDSSSSEEEEEAEAVTAEQNQHQRDTPPAVSSLNVSKADSDGSAGSAGLFDASGDTPAEVRCLSLVCCLVLCCL